MRRLATILCSLLVIAAKGQTFQWWVDNVHWDGVSHWKRYLISTPGYMGPNALPVPNIGNGTIDSVNAVGLSGQFHFSRGDNTQNVLLSGNYCLVKDVISFDFTWLPYEHYRMDHATKEKRHVFSHYYYDDHAAGDVIINTNINLFNKIRHKIHFALRGGYRIPTSNGVGAARFTDAPGYYFDVSMGKPLKNSHWKWIAMAGFYSWQTYSVEHQQNDAFVFGSGLEYNNKRWRAQGSVSGYLGYEDMGDKPILFRASIEKRSAHIGWVIRFQHGIKDYGFTSIETGVKYLLKPRQ
jgi:hypothetical protein